MISGNMVGSYSQMGKTFILTDENGNEITGVIVDQETIFTAGDNDVREGMVYASDEGVSIGTKDIPAYHTQKGTVLIQANASFSIPLSIKDMWDYTALQAVVAPYNTSLSNSVAVDRVVLENAVYPVQSVVKESDVVKDSENKSISLGIINEDTPYVIHYFTYKEEI